MLRNTVDRFGDAGLSALDRLSTRRGLLAKSLVGAGAALGLGVRHVDAANTFYCAAGDGCNVRYNPTFSSTVVTVLSCGQSISITGGAWGDYFVGCLGLAGDYTTWWRKQSGYYQRFVHANLLSTYQINCC